MTTTFETAKVGDRAWSIERGWGVIQSLDGGETYPIIIEFQNERSLSYTLGGKRLTTHELQTLFWDEVVIEAPVKPMPDLPVDTKVLVWVRPDVKLKRHFYQFKDDQIVTFEAGKTSFTTSCEYDVTVWPNWELAE